jgi:hypothetical protein
VVGSGAGEGFLKFIEKPLNKAGNMPIPLYRRKYFGGEV